MSAHSAKWLFAISLLTLFRGNNGQLKRYVPPTPTIEPLHPEGLRMSIPHEEGISLVAYHLKLNGSFNGLEAGDIARDIIKTRNGRWTYDDRTTKLREGDVIYYWIQVIRDGSRYNLLEKQYVVKDFYNEDGSIVITDDTAATTCSAYSETRVYDIGNDTIQLTPREVCPKQLIFEENFDTFNASRWTIVERFSGTPAYEFVAYIDDEDIVMVKNGALRIQPLLTEQKYGEGFVTSGSLTLSKCTAASDSKDCSRKAVGPSILPPILTGRINTENSFAFMYGHVQTRAKLSKGDWICPLLTLESMGSYTGNTKKFYALVLAYSIGNPNLTDADGKDISGHVLYSGPYVVNQTAEISDYINRVTLGRKTSNIPWSDNYHVFDLVWSSREITVSVDGVQFGQYHVPTLLHRPFYINLALAVGGLTFFPDDTKSGNNPKPWRNAEAKALYRFYNAKDDWLSTWQHSDTSLQVDYIKIWAI